MIELNKEAPEEDWNDAVQIFYGPDHHWNHSTIGWIKREWYEALLLCGFIQQEDTKNKWPYVKEGVTEAEVLEFLERFEASKSEQNETRTDPNTQNKGLRAHEEPQKEDRSHRSRASRA